MCPLWFFEKEFCHKFPKELRIDTEMDLEGISFLGFINPSF